MMSGPLVNGSSQTTVPFQFPFIVLLHAEAPSSTFNPRARHLLPLQSSSPTSSLFNFIPSCQLHPSSPTSTLTAANFNPRRLSNSKPPSLCYFLPFSLMLAVCLMLLLPDELLTKIIIHSIKDEAVFHFLNLRNKICGTFRRICNSDEVLLHVSLCDLHEACKNHYARSCFEQRFCEANHPEALCFEGMERLMRRRNPDKGLKLIGDAVAEDSGAKYFLVMLKYHCNPTDLEAMALLQEISDGPSPPDGRWKNHNLRRLPGGTGLMKTAMMTFHCCLSRIPTFAFGQRDVGAAGRIPKRSSTTAASSVTSVVSSTSGRVASAPPWSTPSVG
jgi:hypothetical protein